MTTPSDREEGARAPGATGEGATGTAPTRAGDGRAAERDRGDPGLLSTSRLLRWIYLGRITLVSGILLGALVVWGEAEPQGTFLATVMFAVAMTVTVGSAWYTHVLGREPGHGFRYAQVLVDALLVTVVVDITGGGASPFAWLYIPVISVGALLLPLPGGILLGVLVSVLYLGDLVWRHDLTLTGTVGLQMGLFTVVALATGVLGDRLRRAGLALGAVQSELQQLRLDTSEILDSIATGILTMDARGRLVYVNPAGEALLGLRGEDWVGAPIVDAVRDVSPELGSLLQHSLDRQTPLARRKARVRKDGDEVLLGISTTIRDGEGGPSVTGIFQDITLHERLAEVNRRAERLEAVAEMSASMAHEIKNPLSSIRSAVEQFTRPGLEVEDRKLLTDMVVKESERLSRLLSDFIDFSRLRLGEVDEVDLSNIVRECLAVVRQHPDVPSGVEFRVEGADRPVTVPGDQDLLHRAVFNLVLNAGQFSAPEGEVVVELRDHRRDGRAPRVGVPAPVRLSVRDSGPGVPEEALSRIFDPFYTTRKGGSGLGLAVVHRAVEVHDGAVFVDSATGEGAEFTIYLPGSGDARLRERTGTADQETKVATGAKTAT